MSSSKTNQPFSIRLKLVLLYLYLGTAGSIVSALVLFLAADQVTQDSGLSDPTNHAAAIIISIVFAALFAWVTFLFHKRKSLAPIAFVLLTIASYSLGTLPHSMPSSIISMTTLNTVIYTAVDMIIVSFLLLSKEAKSQFKQK